MKTPQILSTTMKSSRDQLCPLSGEAGKVRRTMTGEMLLSLYETYLGKKFDPQYFDVPPSQEIREYHSSRSGLIWYAPCILGGGDYYAQLDKTYDWYYNPESWDKMEALEEIKYLQPDWVIEIGSGSGWLLRQIELLKITAIGLEISEDMVSNCRSSGLKVYGINEEFPMPKGSGLICMLQTIEHLDSPLEVLSGYISRFNPTQVILSAPCHESLLGHTSDPLAWPPHHFTSWSEKAFQLLASRLGCIVEKINYSPLTYDELESRLARERARKLFGLKIFPKGRIGRWIFKIRQRLGFKWCLRGHSIFARMSVCKPASEKSKT